MPLDPATLVAIANMADQKKQAAISGAVGAWQLFQANKMNKTLGDRPVMEVPQSVQNANILSQRMAANRFLPNQTYAEQSLNTSLAQGADNIYDSAGSSSEALGALVNLYGSRMAGQNDLASMAANNANNNMSNYINDLRATAPYEQQVFNFNEVDPFEQKAAAIQAMRGAGFENFIGGVKGNASASTRGAADVAANQMISNDIEKYKADMKKQYDEMMEQMLNNGGRNAMAGSINAPVASIIASGAGKAK